MRHQPLTVRRPTSLSKISTFGLAVLFVICLGAEPVLAAQVCSDIFSGESAERSNHRPILAMKRNVRVALSGEPSQVDSISLIIPAYRELKNGNIKNFLESLSDQGVDPSKLNIVLVVNNSKEIAADPKSEILAENQQTLQWLKAAMRERRYPYRLHVIDLSTQGTERNMGKIRQAGVDALLRKLPGSLEGHILVHMDSDTRFEPGFLKRLEQRYGSEKNLDAVFFRRDYELRGQPSTEMLLSHPEYHLKRVLRDLKIVLSTHSEGFATYQISSRASTLRDLGGFQPLAKGEDTQLSADLLNYNHILDPTLVVRTEDRSRPDGFTGALRFEELQKNTKSKPLSIHKIIFEQATVRLTEDVQAGRKTFPEALKEFADLAQKTLGVPVLVPNASQVRGVPSDGSPLPSLIPAKMNGSQNEFATNPIAAAFVDVVYKSSFAPGQEAVSLIWNQLPAREQAVFRQIIEQNMQKLANEFSVRRLALDQMLKARDESGSTSTARSTSKDPFVLWAHLENPEFQSYLAQNNLSLSSDRALIVQRLQKDFGPWLGVDQGSLRTQSVYLQSLVEFLTTVRTDSGQLPVARTILDGLSKY